MCQCCRRTRKDWSGNAVECRVNGMDLWDAISAPRVKCPRNRWPDAKGYVAWFWIRWRGVPVFHRAFLEDELTGPLHGCGCVDWAKAKLEKWHGKYRRIQNRRIAAAP